MKFTMESLDQLTLAQMYEFTEVHRDVELIIEGRTRAYSFLEAVLKAQPYRRLSKRQCGVMRRFLQSDRPAGPSSLDS
jgi:hypothetical protein